MHELSYKTWLSNVEKKCKQSGVETNTPLIFLEYITKKSRAYIISHNEQTLSIEQIQSLDALLSRHLNNEPLAYILNNKEFYGRDFYIDENVLIPRPETELIIDESIDFFKHSKEKNINICDIGTGSGCLAISLALEIQNSKVIAYDISHKALEIAKQNAKNLNANTKIDFILQDICTFKHANSNNIYDCIVSNPPYIPEHEYKNLDKNVKGFEPQNALTSGKTGLEIIESVLIFADKMLTSGGLLLIEHGYNQHLLVQELAKKIFTKDNWKNITSIKDYADNWRIFKAIKK